MRLSPFPAALRDAGSFCVVSAVAVLTAASLHAQVAVPVGTRVPVASTAELSSKTAHKGDAIPLTVAADVVLNGHVVIPKGAAVKGTVTEAEKAGRFGKGGKINITLDSLQLPDGQKLGLYADLDDTATVATPAQGGATNAAVNAIPGAGLATGFMHKGDDITFKANQLIPVFTISYVAVKVPDVATPATTPATTPTSTDSTASTIAPAAIGLFDATHTWARAIATLAAHMSATPAVRNIGQQVIQDDSALQVKGAALAAQSHTTVPTLDAETQTKLNGLLHALQATPANKFDATVLQQLYDVQSGFVGNIDPDDDSPMGKLLTETAPVWKEQMATVAKIIVPTK